MNSPVKSISNACLRATLRLSGTLGVEQKRPWSIPLTAIRASVLATARSQVARSWQPAAVASPLTRATTGWGEAGDAQHHAAATLEQGFLERLVPVGVHLLEIVPRAERPARAGQHHDAYRGIRPDAVQRVLGERQSSTRRGD